MRLNNPLSTRPAYYDRAPLTKNGVASVSAPGGTGNTVAWTYTVPVNRKAFIESVMVQVMTNSAGTVASPSTATVLFTPSGGSASRLVGVEFDNITINQGGSLGIGSVGMAATGDVISSLHNNNNTGGSVDIQIHAKFTEFDA